jgi:hypothetical protein
LLGLRACAKQIDQSKECVKIMSKYRIYIDEVCNNDLESSYNTNHRYLSLTGLIFELNDVKDIVTPSLEKLKQKYFKMMVRSL